MAKNFRAKGGGSSLPIYLKQLGDSSWLMHLKLYYGCLPKGKYHLLVYFYFQTFIKLLKITEPKNWQLVTDSNLVITKTRIRPT